MKLKYIARRTDQLTELEKNQVIQLFSRVFHSTKTQAEFEQKYLITPLGYSYHGFIVAGDLIVGAYNATPYAYTFFQKSVLFCQSVDTMVDEKFRSNPFALLNAANLATEAMKRDGISFVWGIPNDNVYEYMRKFLRFRLIGELDTHVLPLDMKVISRRLRFAGAFLRACMKTLVYLPGMPSGPRPNMPIEKVCNEVFLRQRYDYRHRFCSLKQGGKSAYCLIQCKNGVKELLILDVSPLTAENFVETLRKLYAVGIAESADQIKYIGYIPFPCLRIIRVPHFMRRSRVRMLGRILNSEIIDDRVFELKNWNINKSNMDVP